MCQFVGVWGSVRNYLAPMGRGLGCPDMGTAKTRRISSRCSTKRSGPKARGKLVALIFRTGKRIGFN